MDKTLPKISLLTFSSWRELEDEAATECTCVNDISAELQIAGMSCSHPVLVNVKLGQLFFGGCWRRL